MTITDKTGVAISLDHAIGNFVNGVRPTGVNTLELSDVISKAGVKNTVNTTMLPEQLNKVLQGGASVIVQIPAGQGKHSSCVVQQENYLLACYRYIELNPVSAGLVKHPAGYYWTSYRANALGESSKLVTQHPICNELGPDPLGRAKEYQELSRVNFYQVLLIKYEHLQMGNTFWVGPTTIKFNREDPHSVRPDTLDVTYTVDGKRQTARFENEAR
jgi:hypothetical protein